MLPRVPACPSLANFRLRTMLSTVPPGFPGDVFFGILLIKKNLFPP